MSDCSTNAFKAKAQKTCGNCGHSLIGDCVADEYRTAHLNSVTDCGDWFSLEQRHEQLEQVARKMLKHIGWCLSHYSVPWSGYYKEFKDELRECGVSLDD